MLLIPLVLEYTTSQPQRAYTEDILLRMLFKAP